MPRSLTISSTTYFLSSIDTGTIASSGLSSCFASASRYFSISWQCGQVGRKNTSTTTLPA